MGMTTPNKRRSALGIGPIPDGAIALVQDRRQALGLYRMGVAAPIPWGGTLADGYARTGTFADSFARTGTNVDSYRRTGTTANSFARTGTVADGFTRTGSVSGG